MLGVIIGALPLHDGYRHETALPIPIQFSLQVHVALRNGRCHKSDLRQFCETCNGDLLEEAVVGGLLRSRTASFAAVTCSVVSKHRR